MLRNTVDIRTKAFILRRTNYGEADRILSLITPEGKVSAIAKGVRRPKSKLAGGVELFSLVEINLHKGRGDLMTVTGAKMLKYYGNLLKNYNLMELATLMLKKINIASESSDSPEYFGMVESSFEELDNGANADLVYAWFLVNLLKTSGEEINLYRDVVGEKLSDDTRYNYNVFDSAFEKSVNGEYGAEEIKIMRLLTTAELKIILRVKDVEKYVPKIVSLTKIISKEM